MMPRGWYGNASVASKLEDEERRSNALRLRIAMATDRGRKAQGMLTELMERAKVGSAGQVKGQIVVSIDELAAVRGEITRLLSWDM